MINREIYYQQSCESCPNNQKRNLRMALKLFWKAHETSIEEPIPLVKLNWKLFEEKLKYLKSSVRRTYRYLVKKTLKKNNIYLSWHQNSKKSEEIIQEWKIIERRSGAKFIGFLRNWAIKREISPKDITTEILKTFAESIPSRISPGYLTRKWNELYAKGIVPVKVKEVPKMIKQSLKLRIEELPEKLKEDWLKYKNYIVHPEGKRAGNHKVNNRSFFQREEFFLRYAFYLKNVHTPKIDFDKLTLHKAFEVDKKERIWIKSFSFYLLEKVKLKPITASHCIRNLFIPVILYYFKKDVKDLVSLKKKLKRMFKEYSMPAHYIEKIKRIDFTKLEKLPYIILEKRDSIKTLESKARARLTMIVLCTGIMTTIPFRRRTLSELKLNKNIVKIFTDDGSKYKWKIYLYPEDVKGARSDDFYEFDFPENLVPILEEYIEKYRPILLNGKQHDYLFVKINGDPITGHTLDGIITYWTEKILGISVNPHLFRHIMATYFLKKDPGLILAVSKLLLHKSPETVRRYYLQLILDDVIKETQKYYPEGFKNGNIQVKNKNSRKQPLHPQVIDGYVSFPQTAPPLLKTAIRKMFAAHNIPCDQEFPLKIFDWDLIEKMLSNFNSKTAKIYRYLIRNFLKSSRLILSNTSESNKKSKLKEEWSNVTQYVKDGNKCVFSIFKNWAIKQNLPPGKVTIEHIKTFKNEVQSHISINHFVKIWNSLTEKNALPHLLPLQNNQKVFRTLKKSEIPKRLLKDWGNYIQKENIENQKLSKSTWKIRVMCFRRYLYYLKYCQKLKIENLNLTEAMEIDKKNLNWIISFIDEISKEYKPATVVTYLRQFFITIFKYFKKDTSLLRQKIKEFESKVTKKLLPKHRILIEEISFEKLCEIPWILYHQSRRMSASSKTLLPHKAILGRNAAIIALLLLVPMRVFTLAKLKIGRNIKKIQVKGKVRYSVTIYAEDTKAGKKDRFFEIPDYLTPIFEWYYTKCRNIILKGKKNDYFFVGKFRKNLLPKAVSRVIKEVTKKYLKLSIYPHLLRHFIATTLLRRNPRLLVFVTELLLDESILTVLNKYAGFGPQDALNVLTDFKKKFIETEKAKGEI